MARLWMRRDAETHLDDELRFHLEQQIEENVAAGMSRDEARYAALRALGAASQIKEECRDTWALRSFDVLMQDLRYGIRTLRKSPVFALVAILSLGFGIGANAAVFSIINQLLLAHLGVADPDRLVTILRVLPDGGTESEIPLSVFEQFRDHNRVFSGIVGWASSRMAVSWNGEPAQFGDAGFYSGDAFEVLGVHAQIGRVFTAGDDKMSQPAVAVLSDRYWRSHFGANPAVLNRTIEIKGLPVTIVGVLPPGFTGLSISNDYPDLTMPLVWQSRFALNDSGLHANVIARLASSVRTDQANAEMNVIFSRILPELLDRTTSEKRKRELAAQSIQVTPAGRGNRERWRRYRLRLAALMAAVAAVLLIACANVANLTLARSSAREREFAVRSAVGAGHRRLMRQLLTESLLLGAVSGFVGVALALWTGSALSGLLGIRGDVPLDWRVLAFTAAVSIAATVLFGLAPALRASRARHDLASQSAITAIPAARALVAAQVALGLTLAIAAGLLVRSVRNLDHVDAGFDRENVLLFWMYPTTLGYDGTAEARLYERLLDRFNATHGVAQASMARHNLMQRAENFVRVSGIRTALNVTAPGFFATMRIPLLAGRDFLRSDEEKTSRVAIVDDRFAAERFGAENPLGKTVEIDGAGREIVGVVRNVRYYSLRQESSVPASQVFVPFTQAPRQFVGQMCFALRTTGDPMRVLTDVKREAQAVERNLPVVFAVTQAQEAEASMAEERSLAILIALFGGAAVLLACLGVYGLIAYTTARRTNEFGVRIALGASRGDVLRIVLGESATLAALGIAAGVPLTLWATRLIANWLFGVGSSDPATIVAAAALMAAIAAAAGLIPARRASRVDPVVALRHD
jgi:predicted permease